MLEEAAQGGIGIRVLYLPDVGEKGRNEGYHRMEELAAEAGTVVRYIGSGDRLKYGKVTLTCLNPEKGWDTDEINAYSTVLHLSYGDFTALFTGDLEGEGERRVEEMVRGADKLQDITLLKAAHHGSRYSTGEDLLRELKPKLALISSGRGNRYGHPHAELTGRLEDAGCRILGTQESGAVTVYVRNGSVWVETFIKK